VIGFRPACRSGLLALSLPGVQAVNRNAESARHISHRMSSLSDLLDRLDLERFRVTRAAYTHLVACQLWDQSRFVWIALA